MDSKSLIALDTIARDIVSMLFWKWLRSQKVVADRRVIAMCYYGKPCWEEKHLRFEHATARCVAYKSAFDDAYQLLKKIE